jgi:hypothetical protein
MAEAPPRNRADTIHFKSLPMPLVEKGMAYPILACFIA